MSATAGARWETNKASTVVRGDDYSFFADGYAWASWVMAVNEDDKLYELMNRLGLKELLCPEFTGITDGTAGAAPAVYGKLAENLLAISRSGSADGKAIVRSYLEAADGMANRKDFILDLEALQKASTLAERQQAHRFWIEIGV
jgi:hypothetical protein